MAKTNATTKSATKAPAKVTYCRNGAPILRNTLGYLAYLEGVKVKALLASLKKAGVNDLAAPFAAVKLASGNEVSAKKATAKKAA